VEFRTQFCAPFRYQPGRESPVCHRAGRPELAVIDTFSQAWLFPVGSLMIGVAALAAGVL